MTGDFRQKDGHSRQNTNAGQAPWINLSRATGRAIQWLGFHVAMRHDDFAGDQNGRGP